MALWKNTDTQIGQPKFVDVGQVTGIKAGGTMTGYTDGATQAMTLSAPPGGGVQATATAKVVGGVITEVNISNPGAGYTSAPTVTVAPAGGSGATFVVTFKKAVDTNTSVVLVSREESLLAANKRKGIRGPGWYKIVEKMQADGKLRYITEALVAFSNRVTTAVAGDVKGDDLVVGDVEISVTTQPSNSAVTAPAAAAFTVVASGATTYQWQVKIGSAAYVNLTAAGVYAGGVTAATLNITNSTGLTGQRYRCVIGNGGTAQVTTNGALLTVA